MGGKKKYIENRDVWFFHGSLQLFVGGTLYFATFKANCCHIASALSSEKRIKNHQF